jgi:hypothetical protein
MPVYHFIYHAYRSWNTDHPDGYHQHHDPGIHLPNPDLAAYRNHLAHQDPMTFDNAQQSLFLTFATDICTRRNWRLHSLGTDPTHVHIIVSWRNTCGTVPIDSDTLKDRIKNLLSLLLNRHENKIGRRVFSKKIRRRPRQKSPASQLPDHRVSSQTLRPLLV